MASNELPPSSAPPIVGVTTRGIEGQRIAKYIGIVGGETILGVGFERDFIAGIKNFTGARVTEWEDDLQAARYTALTGMMQRAASWGANEAGGVSVDYESLGGIVMVTATGTAVVLEPRSG